MTIALSIKVNDGVVLATDSAATIFAKIEGDRVGVVNVYNNADKLFNLLKDFPIGVITWGSGSIGKASISTLVKDFRKSLASRLKKADEYQLGQIATDFAKYIYEDNYLPAFKDWPDKPNLGFMICGYSARQGNYQDFAEEWKIDIVNGELKGPSLIRGEEQVGMTWSGEPEAITRLYLGFSPQLSQVLIDYGLEPEKVTQEIVPKLIEALTIPFILAPLPIQDAIDIAEFFVQTTITFSKFRPGAPSVGGPIDIAAITKHEGFKWVKRKYYFTRDINPVS